MTSSYITNHVPVRPRNLPDQRGNSVVSMRLALEPGNERHYACRVRVNRSQHNILNVVNPALSETRRIFDNGSGDQLPHALKPGAQAFKRTSVARHNAELAGMDKIGKMWEAARYRAGNCGEMAMVCAQLIASSSLGLPVTVVELGGSADHTYVIVGEVEFDSQGRLLPRRPGAPERIIADPWTMFSRAMLEGDFAFSLNSTHFHTFEPNEDPQMYSRLVSFPNIDDAQVDREFADIDPTYRPASDTAMLQELFEMGALRTQYHSSKNLGVQYSYTDSNGAERIVDQDMTKRQYTAIHNNISEEILRAADARAAAAAAEERRARERERRDAPPPARRSSQRSRPRPSAGAGLNEQMRRMSVSGNPGGQPPRPEPSRPPVTTRQRTSAPSGSSRHSRRSSFSGELPSDRSARRNPTYADPRIANPSSSQSRRDQPNPFEPNPEPFDPSRYYRYRR